MIDNNHEAQPLDELDREVNELAREMDYPAQAQAIKDLLSSPDATDIVGSMELGYVLEKAKEFGDRFANEIKVIQLLLNAHPEYDLRPTEEVMNDLFHKADTEVPQL